MSGDTLTGGRLADLRATLARYRLPSARAVRAVGGPLAAATVCLLAAVRVAINAPLGDAPAGMQAVYAVATAGAVVVPAVAAIGIGAVADADRVVVGLVAAGVFALLAPLGTAAGVPATGVLPAAALLVMVPSGASRRIRDAPDRWLFAGLATAAVAASLGATTGVAGPDARWAGTLAAFLALAVAPAVARVSRRALFAGAVAAVALIAGILAAPFVAGATLLAVGAAVDPGLVAAFGIGGGAAVVAHGAFRRRRSLGAGGLMLVAAGVPASVPRALAVVLGAHLVIVGAAPADEATLPDGATDGGDRS